MFPILQVKCTCTKGTCTFYMYMHVYNIIWSTVDREIFVVKNFSSVTPSTKIECTKNFLQRIIMHTYGIFFVHVRILHAATFRSSVLTARSSISVVLSSWTINDACHTNEFITKLVDRLIVCVDLTTPIGHDPINFGAEEWLCRTISNKISLSLLSLFSDLSVVVPTVLVHKVTYKVWSVFNFRGWFHPQKLNTTNFLRTKYF